MNLNANQVNWFVLFQQLKQYSGWTIYQLLEISLRIETCFVTTRTCDNAFSKLRGLMIELRNETEKTWFYDDDFRGTIINFPDGFFPKRRCAIATAAAVSACGASVNVFVRNRGDSKRGKLTWKYTSCYGSRYYYVLIIRTLYIIIAIRSRVYNGRFRVTSQ